MRYIPLTQKDLSEMLGTIGVSSAEDLLKQIPDELRTKGPVPIAPGLSEKALLDHLAALSRKKPESLVSFLGAGCYDHFVPSVIAPLVTRGEFATSYTPYQPEMAQGTLQAAYEFQSYVCLLTQMEVANSSMYDGATSTAEAMLMASRVTGKKTFAVSGALHPEYLEVLRTYAKATGLHLIEAPFCAETGRTTAESLAAAAKKAGSDLAAIFVQSPNFLGVIEDWRAAQQAAKDAGALFVAVVAEATSLGLLSPPGAFGADIVCGEGQAWGLPMQWGGPFAGFFACQMKYVRQMPGRLVGETVDASGERGFVLTLATREQHIRREKATSNICTSQQLCALWATVWLSLFGKQGLRDLAADNLSRAKHLRERLGKLPGYKARFTGPTYNEFVLDCPKPAEEIISLLAKKKIVPGAPLGRFLGKGFEKSLLVCATEMRSAEEIKALEAALAEVRS